MQVELTFDNEALKAIASFAIKKKMGARGLRAIIEDLLLEPMFETPESDIISVHITEQCAKGFEKPQYKKKRYRGCTANDDNVNSDNIEDITN